MTIGHAYACPEVLGLLLTSKCNISCRHCCNDSHPANSESASLERIARLIDEASEIPSIREVGISGGEPFLYLRLLKETISYARTCGYTSSVTTNGFWGSSPAAGRQLEELKDAGLGAVNISTSPFHQEFLSLSKILGAAKTALSVGLKVTVNVVSTSATEIDDVRGAFDELGDKVRFVVMPCLPAGRALTGVEQQEFPTDFTWPLGNCREHFKKLAVDLSGDVYPCCSPGGFTEPLRMGSGHRSTLGEIVKASDQNKLLAVLESVGPGFFLPFLRQQDNDGEIPKRFSDQCHLCHFMLSSPKYAEKVAEWAEMLVSDLAALPESERPADNSRLAGLKEFGAQSVLPT
ncbi:MULTISPECIES: radical SAM protein [Mesorhizobium]|uniref:Radical SAM superfamily enzyme, MoaA/NifB/PqqE/SkfB family n=1 Tax=Mesorhizobium escarrei TaxID=666018 RepID=A0ABN8KF96_9HYPH|nr:MULTISPECIES: radical SAM protein [Mesorhizobium]CAH2408913.1 Radical SAM superfamily enzyme, MoaA/NifB/PqqE/SkfB family [Mesorhizobium escarrei]